jgi:serpin B
VNRRRQFKISWGTRLLRDQWSRAAPRRSLFISAVFHKALVETNEEGTEAAAATAFAMPDAAAFQLWTPPPDPIFRADHPFLFAIRDRKGGTILFLGRMADPTRES